MLIMQTIKLLATLSALRLEDRKTQHIETALTSLVTDVSESVPDGDVTSRNLPAKTGSSVLASSTWEGVSAKSLGLSLSWFSSLKIKLIACSFV